MSVDELQICPLESTQVQLFLRGATYEAGVEPGPVEPDDDVDHVEDPTPAANSAEFMIERTTHQSRGAAMCRKRGNREMWNRFHSNV